MVEAGFSLKPVHLVFEGKLSDLPIIASIYVYLASIIKRVEMTPVGAPLVTYTETELVGFQIIAESHISVHIQLRQCYLFADLFSCREFDIAQALSYSVQYFGLVSVRSTIIERFTPTTTKCPGQYEQAVQGSRTASTTTPASL